MLIQKLKEYTNSSPSMLIRKVKKTKNKSGILNLMKKQRSEYAHPRMRVFLKREAHYRAKAEAAPPEQRWIYDRILKYLWLRARESHLSENPTAFLTFYDRWTTYQLTMGARFLKQYYYYLWTSYERLADKKAESALFWRRNAARALVELYLNGYDLFLLDEIPDEDSTQILKELPAKEIKELMNQYKPASQSLFRVFWLECCVILYLILMFLSLLC